MKKIPKLLFFLLFFAGVLLGLLLALLSAWADLEANFYGFLKQADTSLYGLSCPIMMTANESSHVSIEISNTTDRRLSPNVKTEISSPFTLIQSFDYANIAPGETTTLQKTIGAENIDLGQFIFVNVLVYSTYPMPNQQSICGVFILPMRGNGTMILIAGTLLSLLFTGSGAYFLRKSGLESKRLNPLLFIAALVPIAIFISFIGWWLPTALVLAVLLLTLVIAIGNFAMH